MIDYIIYTSNAGHTKDYANMLSKQIKKEALSLEEALERKLPKDSKIIYMGWIKSAKVQGYKKANKKFNIKAVVGVGMVPTGDNEDVVRKKSKVNDKTPLFTVQGGFDLEKLTGMNKFIMKVMISASQKYNQLQETSNSDLLNIMSKGVYTVKLENLAYVLKWYKINER